MPRKPAVSHERLHATIHAEADVVDSSSSVPGPSHDVWTRLAGKLQNTLTPNYIYVYVKTNRHGVFDALLQNRGLKKSATAGDASEDSSEDEDTSSDTESTDVVHPKKTFNVIISPEQWNTMKPVRKKFVRKDRPSDRVRTVLPEYKWEPVVIDCIWDQHKLPCPYTFESGTVYTSMDREKYISMEAYCRECGAEAEGKILSEPQEGEQVPLLWVANDTRKVRHSLKRPLYRETRDEVGADLQRNSATAYRRLEASRKMNQGDPEPPTLWKETVLRKCKQQHRDKALHIPEGKDPVKNLEKMKHTTPHAGSIHQIGSSPFFVHYHSPAQLQILRSFASQGHIVLCIDATAGLVLTIMTPNGPGPEIFLYEGVIIAGDIQLPVFQMLSARQDASGIAFWIREFQKQGAPIPNEVVVDDSGALKNSVAITFCGCDSLKDYNKRCFSALNGGPLPLPKCFLRLDLAHFINAACKWKEWKQSTLRRLKCFYIRCLGLLVLSTSTEDFRSTFIAVAVVAGAPSTGDSVKDYIKTLTRRIEGVNLSELEALDEDEEDGEEDCDDPEEDPDEHITDEEPAEDISDFLNDLKQAVKTELQKVKRGDPNGYYASKIKKKLERLVHDFLLWTAIMARSFGSPTLTGSSARVEGDINVLKNGILAGTTQRLRIDKFVSTHLIAIDGTCKIAGAQRPDCDSQIDGRRQRSSTVEGTSKAGTSEKSAEAMTSSSRNGDRQVEKELNEKENWRGKGASPKKPKSSTYLNPCPELSVAMLANALKPPSQRLLQNGLKQGFTKMSNTLSVELSNTCAFDSLVQVMTTAYIQFDFYRNEVDKFNSDVMKVIRSLATQGAVKDTYALRSETLTRLYDPAGQLPSRKTRSHNASIVQLTYNCEDVPAEMSKKCLNGLASVSMANNCSANRCTNTQDQEIIIPDIAILKEDGLTSLAKACLVTLEMMETADLTLPLGNVRANVGCHPPCPGNRSLTCTFGPHLLLDVDIYSAAEDAPEGFSRSYLGLNLFEIPKRIHLCGRSFTLVGVIARWSDHFVAYVRKAFGPWELHNDLHTKIQVIKKDVLVSPVILMYVKVPHQTA